MAGGWRKGAGRPKASHTLEAEAAKRYVIETVVKALGPILATQIAIATSKTHKSSTFAAKELFERALGKVSDKLIIQEVKRLIKLDE